MKSTPVLTDERQIDDVLSRGVENIFPNKEFLKSKLMKGERLTFYLGADPNAPTLHLGHAIPIKKLGQLQKLGHQIIFLIGDFTAMIGDPDKISARKPLTREEVLKNCKDYQKQISSFISFSGPNKALLKFNSEWLDKLRFSDILQLTSHITHAQIIKRDMFQQRLAEGRDLFLHEFLYPVMQGYDSVVMDVDGEVGGNDQTFNMLVGRDLMKKMKNKEKFVIAVKLLTDSTGKKMGKSEGNMVALNQTPEDMFGKVMSWSDNLIIPAFEIVTDIPLEEIKQMEEDMKQGANPKEFKIMLAEEIVTMIHGRGAADIAHEAFDKTFAKGEVPTDIHQAITERETLLSDLLVKEKVVASKSEFRRLIEGKAIREMGTEVIIEDSNYKVGNDITLKIGKKRFIKILVK